MTTTARAVRVVSVADRDYERVLALQRELVERVADGVEPPTLLLCEHDDVVTLGRGNQRGGDPAGEAAPSVDGLAAAFPGRRVVSVERGGGVTVHAPGQLVGYPIVRLETKDVRGFLRRLERGLIDALGAFGLRGEAREGATGVWVTARGGGARKVASIGIAVRRWTTFHGFALNVTTDLARFAGLNPCGFEAGVMTTLERELGRPVNMDEARAAVVERVVPRLSDQLIG